MSGILSPSLWLLAVALVVFAGLVVAAHAQAGEHLRNTPSVKVADPPRGAGVDPAGVSVNTLEAA